MGRKINYKRELGFRIIITHNPIKHELLEILVALILGVNLMNGFITNNYPVLTLISVIIQIVVVVGRKRLGGRVSKLLKLIPTFIFAIIGISLYFNSRSSDGLSSLGFIYFSLLFAFFSLISLIITIAIRTSDERQKS